VRRVASAATVRSLERMLEAVVAEGTGKAAGVPGYAVAGKTGTAQKAIAGGYSPDAYIASFAGFAPGRDPILAGAVILDDPRGGRYHGGEVAAPVFGAIAREILLYEGVAPARQRDERWPGEATQPAAPVRVEPDPASGVALASRSEDVAADGAPPSARVPDFVGMTARQALYGGAAVGLRASLVGRGYVTRQQPPAGAPLVAGSGVELWLATGVR
jgi:membrane peptidoglycan carboxypeptidase